MSIQIIIGKNFGDEGKGLATDYFSARSQHCGNSCLVIRHNGGGQAGHTVDLPDKRFVFHQLSSGSFRNADTYWARTFLPDLYKLHEELEEFSACHHRFPRIFGHPMCRCVCIDDVLINMALETSRGDARHGSCGMGINEAVERSKFPQHCLYLGQLSKMTANEIYKKLLSIRQTYLPYRLAQLGLSLSELGEYGDLLSDTTVLKNIAEQMYRAVGLIIIREEDLASHYEDIIFEGAQGLLLDENHLEFAPHLTSSSTGLSNPFSFIWQYLPEAVPEIVYVTRSYVTRHGAGPLPNDLSWQMKFAVNDPTNLPNPWQGALRFAPHGTVGAFFAPMLTDLRKYTGKYRVSCMVTHLNESDGMICSTAGDVPVDLWFAGPEVPACLHRVYLSYTPCSQDITILERENFCCKTENTTE